MGKPNLPAAVCGTVVYPAKLMCGGKCYSVVCVCLTRCIHVHVKLERFTVEHGLRKITTQQIII